MKASNIMVNIPSCKRKCNGSNTQFPIARQSAGCDIGISPNTSWRRFILAPAFITKAVSGKNFGCTMLHEEQEVETSDGHAELASETEEGFFPSRRPKYGAEREMSASAQQISRAPAQIFTRRKSHITNILINIARQISSCRGTAQKMVGGIRSNIDAFTGWRIRNDEGKAKTAIAGTAQMTNRKSGTQNSGTKQQSERIQHFAPALLFSAITNHILYREARQ